MMADATKTSWNYVWVKDRAGNEFVCKVDALEDPKGLSEEERKACVDDASRALPVGD